MEIFLKFNTCYYSKGAVIENRYMIAKNYLKNCIKIYTIKLAFFFDLFVVIPYFLSLRFDVEYLDLVIILKIF